jgi:cell division GTPase FtsZ
MKSYLKSLRKSGDAHIVEPMDEGFAIVRKEAAMAAAFNEIARQAMEHSGLDYVALPRSDGQANYDRVFIIPLD